MRKLNHGLVAVLAFSFMYCACDSFEEDFLSDKRKGSMMPHKLTPVDRSELRQIVRQGHIEMLSGVDTSQMTTDQKYAYVQDSLWSLKNAFSEAHRIIRSEAERRRTLQTPFTEAEHKSFRRLGLPRTERRQVPHLTILSETEGLHAEQGLWRVGRTSKR